MTPAPGVYLYPPGTLFWDFWRIVQGVTSPICINGAPARRLAQGAAIEGASHRAADARSLAIWVLHSTSSPMQASADLVQGSFAVPLPARPPPSCTSATHPLVPDVAGRLTAIAAAMAWSEQVLPKAPPCHAAPDMLREGKLVPPCAIIQYKPIPYLNACHAQQKHLCTLGLQ